jgi:hypothetical protein
VLRLALHLYRHHAPGLLALTAIYAPLGLIAVGLQDLLAHVPPFSNILDFFDARAAGALLGLVYGSIESLLALMFVMAVLTDAIADAGAGVGTWRSVEKSGWRAGRRKTVGPGRRGAKRPPGFGSTSRSCRFVHSRGASRLRRSV